MNVQNYHALRAGRCVHVPRRYSFNPLPSETDPTQDCPVSQFQFGPDGSVINCRNNGLPYNGVPIEKMTLIESRHRDKFDVLGQQQALATQASNGLKGAKKTPIINPQN